MLLDIFEVVSSRVDLLPSASSLSALSLSVAVEGALDPWLDIFGGSAKRLRISFIFDFDF